MDAADRALLEASVRAGLSGTVSADDALAQLGWLEMLAAEERDAVDVVFTALGVTNCTATVLDDVVVAALGLEPDNDLAVALPGVLVTARIDTASHVVVVDEDGQRLVQAVVPTADVDVTPVSGIDPDAGMRVARMRRDLAGASPLDPAMWDAAIAAGRRAVAHQLIGACRTMLDLARTHAIERVQFGRPIVRFQAVRHRLAESLVAIEAAEATVTAAWDEPGPMTAALAKAAAGRATRTVAAHCQQVLAGIGFTTDHPFHRYLKRTMALDGLFGSADDIVLDVGRQLLAARAVPTLVDL